MLDRPMRARDRDQLLFEEGALTKHHQHDVRSRMAKMGWCQRKTGMAPPHGPEWEYVKLDYQLNPENVLGREGDEMWKRDLREAKMEPGYRKALRKYRKLKRMAEREGVDLDTLLLRRRSARKWQAWVEAAEDQRIIRLWHYKVNYAVRVLETYKERIETDIYNWRKRKKVPQGRTARTVRFEVVGYYDIRYGYTSLEPPTLWAPMTILKVGEQFTVSRPLGWAKHITREPVPLADCIQVRANHCKNVMEQSQRKVDTVPREQWFTDYERDVQTWSEGYSRWMKFKSQYEGPDYAPRV